MIKPCWSQPNRICKQLLSITVTALKMRGRQQVHGLYCPLSRNLPPQGSHSPKHQCFQKIYMSWRGFCVVQVWGLPHNVFSSQKPGEFACEKPLRSSVMDSQSSSLAHSSLHKHEQPRPLLWTSPSTKALCNYIHLTASDKTPVAAPPGADRISLCICGCFPNYSN